MFSWLLRALCIVTPAFFLPLALQEAGVAGSLGRELVTVTEHSDAEQLLTTSSTAGREFVRGLF